MRGILAAAVVMIVLCVGATAQAHWGYVVAVPVAPAPVVAYYPPVAPAYVAAYPAPYVAGYVAPAYPYVASYAVPAAPVYYGWPVAVGPAGKIYPYGQPVRNAARFVLPPW